MIISWWIRREKHSTAAILVKNNEKQPINDENHEKTRFSRNFHDFDQNLYIKEFNGGEFRAPVTEHPVTII